MCKQKTTTYSRGVLVELIAMFADPVFEKRLDHFRRSRYMRPVWSPPKPPRQVQVRLTEREVDELVAAHQRGDSPRQLAEQFKINKNTVLEHLGRRQVPPRVYRKVHGDLLKQAKALYEAGNSLRSVALRLEVSRTAVTEAFRLAGVSIRTK